MKKQNFLLETIKRCYFLLVFCLHLFDKHNLLVLLACTLLVEKTERDGYCGYQLDTQQILLSVGKQTQYAV